MAQTIRVGTGSSIRDIAFLIRRGRGPPIVWLPGFRSDMRSVKATALAAWATARRRPLVRFDYAGHGESGGTFEESGISQWLEDALAVIGHAALERPILVGSSMGGWIALLAARALGARPERAPKGLVLVAPAVDFTEKLLWERFPKGIRRTVMQRGVFHRPSAFGDEAYPITRLLIEDGRRHLLLGKPIATGCPVHILQGMQDPEVPYTHALQLMEHLPGEDASLTLIADGDHRLSRPQDIERLISAVEAMAKGR